MFKHFLWVCLLLPSLTYAFDIEKLKELANNPQLNQQQVEQLTNQMLKAAECVDVEALQKLSAEGEAMQKNVQQLCREGNRAGAEKVVIAFSKRLATSSEFESIKACGEKFKAFIPPEYLDQAKAQASSNANKDNVSAKHICDEI